MRETGQINFDGADLQTVAKYLLGDVLQLNFVVDPRVQGNEAYLILILLSRVVTRLGSVTNINPKTIESLYAGDLAYLQEFYNRINRDGKSSVDALCPKCAHQFEVALDAAGGF